MGKIIDTNEFRMHMKTVFPNLIKCKKVFSVKSIKTVHITTRRSWELSNT